MKDIVVPVRLTPEMKAKMDKSIYKLSRPGAMLSQADYIRAAIAEKNKRTLSAKREDLHEEGAGVGVAGGRKPDTV